MLYGIHVVFLRSYAAFSPSRELSCTSVTKEAFQGCREFLCELSRTSLTKEAFQGCREFLCISVPSAVMICLQWWSFELLILLSGLLPKAQLETSGFDKNRKKILLADLKYL